MAKYLALGWKIEDIRNKFKREVESHSPNAIFERGEWLVAVFEGIMKESEESTIQRGIERRSKAITDAEDLRDMRVRQADWHSQINNGRAVVPSIGSTGAPAIDIAVMDKPVLNQPEPVGASLMMREVCSWFVHGLVVACSLFG